MQVKGWKIKDTTCGVVLANFEKMKVVGNNNKLRNMVDINVCIYRNLTRKEQGVEKSMRDCKAGKRKGK